MRCSEEMCDEFVCSDSGVVSLCEDDRKLLASLGAKKSQQIHEREETREEKGERGERGEREVAEVTTDNNNVDSETNRNLNTDSKTDQQGILKRWRWLHYSLHNRQSKINDNLDTFIFTIWSYSVLIVLIFISVSPQSTPQFQK